MRWCSKSAWRRLLAVSMLVAAVLAALMMPVGAANAAVTGSTTKPAGNSTPAGRAAPVPRKQAVPTKPTAPPKPKAVAVVSPDAARKARAAAATHAIAASTVPNTCSGAIQPDTIYPCTGSAGPEAFTATLTSTTDLLLVEVMSTNGGAAASVTGPDGTAVTCQQGYGPLRCPTSAAGAYTIQVSNSGSDFTLDYRPLLSDASCTTADTSFAAPTIQGNLANGSVGDCYLLNLPSGSALDYQVTGEFTDFVDATGAQLCANGAGCTLTGTGPFRVNVSGYYSAAASAYQLRLNSLTNPQGCVAVGQQVYGQVPDTSSVIRCRALTVASAGEYQIYGVWTGGSPISTLYNLDGSVACTNSGPDCDLAAGTYSFVMSEDVSITPIPFGVVFIAANESSGCTTTGDTDFATGAVTGTFAGLGEEICLTLPTAAGLADYVMNQLAPSTIGLPSMQVVDAMGAQQCSDSYYTYHVCALAGSAPFRLVLSDSPAGSGYQELVQRTDSTAGCAAWPQSGFGGSWGVQASLDPSVWGRCFSIPANAHSTGEMIDYANTANKVNAAVTINDPAGKEICFGNSLGFCSYQAGVAYTALLMSPQSVTDTYQLVRRDVSSSASCGAPASTTVGGASTELPLSSDLDAGCFHVGAAGTDLWWMDVRAVAPNNSGAVLVVTDPTGKIVCRQWGTSCNVTGSLGYQAIVIASGYAGVTIPAHVDIWQVGTASGWASQCTAHQLSATGFPMQAATLTETSTAYCAVVQMSASQTLGLFGSDTATGGHRLGISMYLPSDWTNGLGLCNLSSYGVFGIACGTQSNGPTGSAVFLVTPGTAPAPVSYVMQGVCRFTCPGPPVQTTISSVSPATGPAGIDRITITGTGLNLGTQISLASNYSVATNIYTPVSVSADGTALTVDVDTYGVTPGTYDVLLDSPGYTVGTPSPGYLPNAFTVTAAPPAPAAGLLMPLTPTRLLDTRHGVGAPQARVASGGTVKLQVGGVAGIPATGVTAVVLNTTVTGPAAGGYVTVYPDGTSRPTASNLNFSAGETIPNLVVVPVVNGKVDFYNGSGGALDLIADVTGYYTSSGSGSALNTVGPARVLDTRHGVGAPQARVAAGGTVKLQVAGVAGIPATGVTAVVLNTTVTGPAASGYLTVYPDGSSRPTASNLNFSAGETIPNLVVVPVVNGAVDFFNGSGGALDLIADVTGYYASTGAAYHPAGPTRAMDTRSGLGGAGGAVAPGTAAVLPITGSLGQPVSGNVTAVVLNVTVTGSAASGYLTVYPDGSSRPTASNLNFSAGETIPNLVVVPVVNGNIVFYNGSGGDVQIIADVEGYFSS